MGQIQVEKNVNGIEGLCIIIPTIHKDTRGYFMETYSKRDMKEAGFDIEFVQDNQSYSTKGVLRGLHYQKKHPQTKLVRVLNGSVYSVAVDLRTGSSTYRKWHGVLLTGNNCKQFLIPKGFAHGFLILSDSAVFCYKCDDFYYPDDENGIIWNDPSIDIQWVGLKKEPSRGLYTLEDGTSLKLSDKDKRFPELKDLTT